MTNHTNPETPVLSIPVLKNVKPAISRSAESDGELIFKFLVTDHGFGTKRFLSMTRDQQDYIESTLCIIIRSLCDHLQTLGEIKR